MKALRSLSILVASLALSSSVFAQLATKDIIVGATLTSACRFVDSSSLTLTSIPYTAFQAATSVTSGAIAIECTRTGPAPTITWDATFGTVAGLRYNMTSTYSAGGAGAAPLAGDAADLGTARTSSITVTASIPGGQAGTNGAAATDTRQVTVAY